MVKMAPIIAKNQRILQSAFAAKHSHRFGQQYGSLLAGYWAMVHDGEIDGTEVKKLVELVHLDREVDRAQKPTPSRKCWPREKRRITIKRHLPIMVYTGRSITRRIVYSLRTATLN